MPDSFFWVFSSCCCSCRNVLCPVLTRRAALTSRVALTSGASPAPALSLGRVLRKVTLCSRWRLEVRRSELVPHPIVPAPHKSSHGHARARSGRRPASSRRLLSPRPLSSLPLSPPARLLL